LIEKDEEIVLLFGRIDDFDRAYLNGKQIGKTYDGERFGSSGSFNEFRVYTIPPNLLRDRNNLIEVLVEEMGNIGGIYEGSVGLTTRTAYERYYR